MKNLLSLIISVILCCGTSCSQIYTPVTPTTYGNNFLRVNPFLVQHLPEKSGLSLNTSSNKTQIFYNILDSSVWVYSLDMGYFKLGGVSSVVNIYNSNGSLTGNRLLNGNDYNLGFHVDSLDFQAQSGVHLYGGTVFDANFDLINFTSNSTKVSHLTSALIKSDENHYLQNADSLVDYVTPSQLLPITLTGGTGSYSLPAGKLLEKVEIIEPTSIVVDIGTTMGDDNIASAVSVGLGYANYTFNYYNNTGSNQTIYFSNFTGSTVAKLYIR